MKQETRDIHERHPGRTPMTANPALDELTASVAADDHALGPPDATVTLVQYAEFECPHCGRAHFQLKDLRGRLDELGARFVFRHLARDEVHPFSVRAAVTAEAAGKQGRFWEMHDHLFEHQHALELDDLRAHAEAVGLDVPRFEDDLSDEALLTKVRMQSEAATAGGIEVTPTFLLNGELYEGSYDVRSLVAAIKRAKNST